MATRRKAAPSGGHAGSFDVAIVGAGPVGLTIANTLGLYGLSVAVIEKLDRIIDYPRAIGIDDEALRTIQATGLAEEVQTHITPDHWMKFVTATGRVFASIEPRTDEFGWSRRNAFIQPEIDRILHHGLERFPNVRVLLGHGLAGFEQDADGVTLNLERAGGEPVALRASWMVACDGGNSLVRRTLDIPFEGRTKPNQWIVVDIRNDPLGTPHVYLCCDPVRPYVSAALPHGVRRFEFMVMPGETEADFEQPENLAKLMRKVVPDPDKVDYIRKRVYTHNARLAARFRQGRVLLAGDAAHIMPVWQGQGYNSGIRDAGNWPLAPKLGILAFLFLVIVAAGAYFDWKDQYEALDKAETEEMALRAQYTDKKNKAINYDLYRQQLAEIEQSFGALLKQLPNKSEMDALLTDINQAGLGRGLSFELFKPAASERMAEFYAELPIAIKITGNYHDMGAFASDVAQLPRIVTLNDVAIANDKGVLTLDAVAKTYRYLDEEEVAKQRRLAKEAKEKGKK